MKCENKNAGYTKANSDTEKVSIAKGGTTSDQIARRVLERVSDTELNLLHSAARAQLRGRELTPAECSAEEAYFSAVERESVSAR